MPPRPPPPESIHLPHDMDLRDISSASQATEHDRLAAVGNPAASGGAPIDSAARTRGGLRRLRCKTPHIWGPSTMPTPKRARNLVDDPTSSRLVAPPPEGQVPSLFAAGDQECGVDPAAGLLAMLEREAKRCTAALLTADGSGGASTRSLSMSLVSLVRGAVRHYRGADSSHDRARTPHALRRQRYEAAPHLYGDVRC